MPPERGQLMGWQPAEQNTMRGVEYGFATESSSSSSQLPVPRITATPASQRQMAPSSDRRAQRNRVRDPTWVPRPRNAFIIFRCEYAKEHTHANEGGLIALQGAGHTEKTLSKRAAEAWKVVSAAEKAQYKQMADDERDEHARLNPDYRFRPVKRQAASGRNPSGRSKQSTSSSTAKRSGRTGRGTQDASQTEDRCDQVASLVMQGRRPSEIAVEMHGWQQGTNLEGRQWRQPDTDWQNQNDWHLPNHDGKSDGQGWGIEEQSFHGDARPLLSNDLAPENHLLPPSPASTQHLPHLQQFLPPYHRRSSSVPLPDDNPGPFQRMSTTWARNNSFGRMSTDWGRISVSGGPRRSIAWGFNNNVIAGLDTEPNPNDTEPQPGLRRSRSAMGGPPAVNLWDTYQPFSTDFNGVYQADFPTHGGAFEFASNEADHLGGEALFAASFSFQQNGHGSDPLFQPTFVHQGIGPLHVAPSPSNDNSAPTVSEPAMASLRPDSPRTSSAPSPQFANPSPLSSTQYLVPTQVFSVPSSQSQSYSTPHAREPSAPPPASPLSLVATTWNGEPEPSVSAPDALQLLHPIPTHAHQLPSTAHLVDDVQPISSPFVWGATPNPLVHGNRTYGAWHGGPLDSGAVPSKAWPPGAPANGAGGCYEGNDRALHAYELGLDGLGVRGNDTSNLVNGRAPTPPLVYSNYDDHTELSSSQSSEFDYMEPYGGGHVPSSKV